MHRKFHEVWTCGFDICQKTDRHADTLVVVLRTHPRGEVSVCNCTTRLSSYWTLRTWLWGPSGATIGVSYLCDKCRTVSVATRAASVDCALHSAVYCLKSNATTRRSDDVEVKKILQREYEMLGPIRYCSAIYTFRSKHITTTQK